jgi:NADH-quinone oxidoreductase subunit N
VDNEYAFLAVAIVLGSAISLAYYLRVVAAVWMSAPDEARGSSRAVAPGTARPAIAGGSQEADGVLDTRTSGAGIGWVTAVAVVCAIATIAIGIYPEPLLNVANDAGAALRNLL